MEFAGKEIYLSKLKKEKINKIRKSEEENKEEAPGVKEEDKKEDEKEEDKKEEDGKEDEKEDGKEVGKKYEKKGKKYKRDKNEDENDQEMDLGLNELDNKEDIEEIDIKLKKYTMKKKKRKFSNDSGGSDLSDDARLSVCSAEFDKDLEKSNSDVSMDEEPAPMDNPKKKGRIFKKEIDTNICLIHYNELENDPEYTIFNSIQCIKCQAYLNKYSQLIQSENGKYEWKCEFCSEINKGLIINKKDIPLNENVEICIEPPINIEKKTKDGNDTSLIFCFDISGSMCQSYNVGEELKEKFNRISGKKSKKKRFNYDLEDDDDIDFDNYDFNQENTSYISRLDLVKISIENNINSLLKNSPDTKVGIVSFGSEIEVKGDCLSNVMKIKEKDMNNEAKIKSLGEENTNLIKAPIKQSSSKILESLKATEENGSTALGPAVLLSLSLLKNAKIGSRIFLCTDGMSNLGIGDISQDKDGAKAYYSKIGDMARDKGIVINLITFEDSESEIDILMNMVQKSGGEIIRVNPNAILDGFNDLLENETIASEVSIKMNLNKCMTFRDKAEIDLINDGSSITEKIGNATKETETYYELKFKKALKLAEMKDINFDKLNNLTFQCEITYKKKDGGKYVRIISRNLKISDNKEEVENKANYELISTMEIQKSAKLASAGLYREAQAQAHITRKFLNKNIANNNSKESYQMFNSNMNRFNRDLGQLNLNKKKKKQFKMEKKEEEFNYKNDNITEQIFTLSKTSQNRQKMKYNRSKK